MKNIYYDFYLPTRHSHEGSTCEAPSASLGILKHRAVLYRSAQLPHIPPVGGSYKELLTGPFNSNESALSRHAKWLLFALSLQVLGLWILLLIGFALCGPGLHREIATGLITVCLGSGSS